MLVQKIFLDWFENNADSYDLVCTDTKIKYISFYGDLEFGEKADYVPVKPSSRQVDPPEPNTVPKYIINFDGEGDPVTAAKPTAYVNQVSSDGTAPNQIFDMATGTFKAGSSS